MPELLQSKLHVPPLRRTLLPRPRLSSQLDGSLDAALTLVSAPAGFGKTTLLSEWSSRSPLSGRSTAWVSLDERDNDPASFWAYVVAALQTVAPDLGAAAMPLLQSPQAPAHAGLEQLLNDLQAHGQDLQLVLDDYHVIHDTTVHEGLALLLDHLPAHVHVILGTRVDPPLQLARLRARGQLVEVRAADLRFTSQEAADYLQGPMGLSLTEQDVAALDGRTEGWAAALQLAALSMQGRRDVSGFLAGFSGDDRFVVDYLAEEVLQRLPEHVRRFLLRTSVLSRMNGALCDAVTAEDGGRAALEALDRQNMFVVPLDDQRRWYRYHHLFADVLRARLLDEEPELVPPLHLRASEWYAAQGDLVEAVHHAVTGEHWERAADLVERAVPALRRDRREATMRRWLEALPEHLVRARPVLGISYVGSLMSTGELAGVEAHLQEVERWLEGPGAGAPADVGTDPLLRTLPGTVAMYRAGQARLLGDVEGTIAHAQRALDLAGEQDHLERGAATALLGLAHWTTGDVETAARSYLASIDAMQRAGHVADLLGCTIALADLEVVRGRPAAALAAYRRALAAAQQLPAVPRGTADMHTGLATLLLERDEVDAAAEHLRAGAELGEHAALAQDAYRRRLTLAAVRQVEGDLAGALDLLDEAERVYDTDYSPDVRPVAAVRARLHLALGRTEDALAWARARGLAVDDEMSYLREYEHLTLARILLREQAATARPAPGLDLLLDRLLAAAEESGRTGSVIDALLLQVRAAHARHEPAAAAERLGRALVLAEPHGHVRTFVDHGPVVAELLRSLVQHAAVGAYARRLLDAAPASTPARHGPQEGLSERESEVLRLLASDLDGPGIARSLVVSVHTVRSHTKSIYAKLGVSSRREAVRRAQDLGLLARGSRA